MAAPISVAEACKLLAEISGRAACAVDRLQAFGDHAAVLTPGAEEQHKELQATRKAKRAASILKDNASADEVSKSATEEAVAKRARHVLCEVPDHSGQVVASASSLPSEPEVPRASSDERRGPRDISKVGPSEALKGAVPKLSPKQEPLTKTAAIQRITDSFGDPENPFESMAGGQAGTGSAPVPWVQQEDNFFTKLDYHEVAQHGFPDAAQTSTDGANPGSEGDRPQEPQMPARTLPWTGVARQHQQISQSRSQLTGPDATLHDCNGRFPKYRRRIHQLVLWDKLGSKAKQTKCALKYPSRYQSPKGKVSGLPFLKPPCVLAFLLHVQGQNGEAKLLQTSFMQKELIPISSNLFYGARSIKGALRRAQSCRRRIT